MSDGVGIDRKFEQDSVVSAGLLDFGHSINLQSLINTHELPFVVIDRNFRVVAVNKAYQKVYGLSAGQVTGRPCYQVSHYSELPCFDSGGECPHEKIYAGGDSCSCLHVHYDDMGGIHRVRFRAYPLQDANGEMFLGEVIEELSDAAPGQTKQLNMVGKSPAFLKVLEQLDMAATSDAPVLLEGETGTGKDLAANYIHLQSRRHDNPFLTLDCTVLTESLFESEVFGHEQGAFTGSVGKKEGLFELVDGGTLFLDEIGELPVCLQAKLLRVLETGEYRRVGGRKTLHTNARIICATNRNLGADVEARAFREDLYYRIACMHIRIPDLRTREQDIPLLARALLDRIRSSTGKGYELAPDAIRELERYDYPGNVRELRNILSVAAAHSSDGVIAAPGITAVIGEMKSRRPATCDEQLTEAQQAAVFDPGADACTLESVEARHIHRLLKQYNNNRRKVAAALDVSERTLYRKLKRYQLS